MKVCRCGWTFEPLLKVVVGDYDGIDDRTIAFCERHLAEGRDPQDSFVVWHCVNPACTCNCRLYTVAGHGLVT